ncbi:MAG: oligoendopeptidase F [Anaerolineaceae bacterium]|nr:oligoendopeptidase F [Anaerolineaceae bacterium]
MTAPSTIPPRSAIDKAYTWNAESVFESRAAWAAEYTALTNDLQKLSPFQGKLGESPAILANWMDLTDTMLRRVSKLYVYAGMSQSVDTNDQEAVSMAGQAQGVMSGYMAAAAFAQPEILAIGLDTLKSWMQTEPRLAICEHYFDDLYRKGQHVRSAEVEALLGMVNDPFSTIPNTAGLLVNGEIPFRAAISSSGESIEVGQSNIHTLLHSDDREIRRTAWESYMDGYLGFKNTIASNLAGAIKRDVFFARARRYPSSLEASIFPNNIPQEVFHNLIDTFRKHIPTWHKYWAIRRRALGVETLHEYDIWAPLTRNEPEVSYGQAVDWICEGLKPLGEDYVNTLRRGCLQDRWVDVYPNVGKRQGAFSSGSAGTHPFIMMSFGDDLGGMSTLAHELGHSMHSYLTWQNQPAMYSRYSMFVAEVASNFNQALTRAHLMQTHSDPDFQIALIQEAMANFHRYFFIMPTLARFELEVHQRAERGAGLTAKDMNALMVDLFSEGYGSEMQVHPDRTGITWATFQHMYMNFYVFQYATGIAAAHALADRVLTGGESAVQDYLTFLKTGNARYSMDTLRSAGVDMTTPEAVEKTFAVMAGYIDRLAELTG